MSWPSHVAVTLPAASFRPRQPSQCTLILFTERLDLEGVRPSVGSVGDAYDNALMESVIDLYKTEYLHSTLDYVSPVDYEQAHYATPQPRAATRMRATENLGRFSISS